MKLMNLTVLKMSAVAIVIGAIVGLAISGFALSLQWCDNMRIENGYLIYLLPLAGLGIVAIYKGAGIDNPGGTNRVIWRIHDNSYVKAIMTPLIFLATVISQFFGASVGREAAALQIGGSLGSFVAQKLKVGEQNSSIVIICGMSAAFSALFGTPIAAALFALELADARIKKLSAIIPSFISSGIAFLIGKGLLVPYLNVDLNSILALDLNTVLLVILLAIFCAIASIIFVTSKKLITKCFSKLLKNQYVRIFVCGTIVVLITFIVGDQTFNGVGSRTIQACLAQSGFTIVWWAFLLKILLTSISLGGGYQGGEIIPVLFIGATLGNAFSQFFPIDACVASALGMIGLFSASTKCPLASIAISFELFGFNNPLYFLITIIISTICSGTFRIYEEQSLPSFKQLKVSNKSHLS